MIIKGTDFTAQTMWNTGLQKKAGNAASLASAFGGRRFDVLDLSAVFKNLEGCKTSDVEKLRQMLSEPTGNETIRKVYTGAYNYAKMSIAASIEEVQSKGCKFQFSNYAEEKAHYTEILSDESLSEADRVSAQSALDNVQGKIDKLLDKLNSREPRMSRDEFNSCAANLKSTLGIDSEYLSESQYDVMFGKTEYTEENALEKLSERSKALTEYHSAMSKKMDGCIKNIQKNLSPKDRILIPALMKLAYNDAFGCFIADNE